MKKILLSGVVLGVILTFNACLNDKEYNKKVENEKVALAVERFYLEDNEYTESAYSQDLSVDSLTKDLNVTVKKIPTINKHNLNQIDTLVEITKEGNFFRFHKGEEYEILDSFSITSPNFVLKNNIMVGLSRKDFIAKFLNLSSKADVISVGNNEKSEVFTFHFIKDSLKQIFYSGYVD